jgi:hypothetical protein
MLIERADALMGCTENSPEEAELVALTDVIEAYESRRWPDGNFWAARASGPSDPAGARRPSDAARERSLLAFRFAQRSRRLSNDGKVPYYETVRTYGFTHETANAHTRDDFSAATSSE